MTDNLEFRPIRQFPRLTLGRTRKESISTEYAKEKGGQECFITLSEDISHEELENLTETVRKRKKDLEESLDILFEDPVIPKNKGAAPSVSTELPESNVKKSGKSWKNRF